MHGDHGQDVYLLPHPLLLDDSESKGPPGIWNLCAPFIAALWLTIINRLFAPSTMYWFNHRFGRIPIGRKPRHSIGTPYGRVVEMFDPKAFARRSSAAKRSQKYGACVTIFSPQQLEECGARMFRSAHGEAFAAVTRSGELINVVRHRGHSVSDDFYAVMTAAVMEGATFLECIDTVTVPIYMRCGFVPVARAKWNDHFMPSDWNKALFLKYNDGEPCYVYMVRAGQLRIPCISGKANEPGTRPLYRRDDVRVLESEECDRVQMEAVQSLHHYRPEKVADAHELKRRHVA